MAPKNSSHPIPTGWTLENEVLKDGSKCSYYYCQGTKQQFYGYADLMRYVNYAKKAKVGIYSPNCKSCKRSKKEAEDSVAPKSRKIYGLSISSKPSSSSKAKSLTVDQKSESSDKEADPDYMPVSESSVKIDQSPSESESSDREADPDYMPISESSVQADSQPSETELEVGQVPTAEMKDLESDGHTSS